MNVLFSVIDPVAISFGPIEIYWYGIIIALAMLLGISLATKEAQKMGLEEDTMTDMALWAIPIGFIGARLYYVLFKWEYYLQNPNEIIAIWNGGIAIYGGLIAGGLAVYWFARRKKMTLTLLLDILAPSVLLAQSIGRWGNFINQDAHGGPVTRQFLENLYLPEFIINQMNINGTYYHPTFLYESLWSLVGFALLLLLRNKNQFLRQGEVALSYVIWYSAGRFFIEGMRTDSLWIGDFLRISQGLSLVLFVAALGVLMYRRYYTYLPVPYYKDEPKLL
ncbi:prolipoprotein diacylglyceryl transferase [Globicatella sulfidifaciens]